ncbi:hypothetical protein [Nostoc sp.]
MAYIPKNAEWYIAELAIECNVEGNPHGSIHFWKKHRAIGNRGYTD